MKLEKWALIAEISSGAAVVITLVFLILGIRDNSEITRASPYADTLRDLNDLERQAMSDPDLNRVYGAYLQMETEGLGEEDMRILQRIVVTQTRIYDMAYSMERYGLLGPNEWQRFERFACGNYGRALSAGFGDTYLALGSVEYQRFVTSSCGGQ